MATDHPTGDAAGAVGVVNPKGAAPVVIACEHASAAIPTGYRDLGLSATARHSHAAWDIGASGLARALARRLDAPLVTARQSRLVFDCNRPVDAPAATPAQVEIHDVPGNANLDPAERAARAAAVHAPFHAALAATLAARPAAALVTIHSFTPVWHGTPRAVEIGYLHGADDRLARALLAATPKDRTAALNAPYGPDDGVLYTIDRHGTSAGRPCVMIEVRNDLIRTTAAQESFAALLETALQAAEPAA